MAKIVYLKKNPKRMKSKISKRSSSKVSKSVRTYISKAISVKKENRRVVYYGSNQALNTALAGSNPTSYLNLLPQPTRNINDDGRIGNVLTIKSGIIKGYVNLLPYNSINNPTVAPMYVKMWIVSCKTTNSSTLADTNISLNFFDAGANATGFQNTILDLTLPNSKETWTLHYSKVIKLGLGSGTTAYPSTNIAVNDNSSFTRPFYFNWGKKVKTRLKYLDGGAYPTNKNLWLIMTAVPADGNSTTLNPAEYHYTNVIEYEC